MKITIIGFSVEAQRIDYMLQTLVKGSITGTYSTSKPAQKSIACNVLEHLGAVSAGPHGDTLQPEQALLGLIYATHYQGSFNDLTGRYGESREVPDNMVWERAKAVELPTADDLAYIEENAQTLPQRKLFSAPGLFVSSWVFGDKSYLITDRKGLCVWVNQGEAPAYVADSIKDAHGWIKRDVQNTLERLLR